MITLYSSEFLHTHQVDSYKLMPSYSNIVMRNVCKKWFTQFKLYLTTILPVDMDIFILKYSYEYSIKRNSSLTSIVSFK